MTKILIDGISNITLHNGIVRVECTTVGADGQQHSSGTLLIPGGVAAPVVQALINGMQELDKKIREQTPTPATLSLATSSNASIRCRQPRTARREEVAAHYEL